MMDAATALDRRASMLRDVAERALASMRDRGFEHAQVGAAFQTRDELNLAHNEPSLLRSTESHRLKLSGLLDGRMAAVELSDFDPDVVEQAVAKLWVDVASAPQDAANAVSSGQTARIVQGPMASDADLLAAKLTELLEFRARETPKMMLEEGLASHTLLLSQTFTSGGSDLACRAGWQSLSAFGTAREGSRASSFNHAGGDAEDLSSRPAAEWFGIERMMRDAEQQIHAAPIGEKLIGDVVLTPAAVNDLLGWLLSQLGDVHLIAGSSLYRDKVGGTIAAPGLSVRSRFDAAGVVGLTSDAFVAPAVELVSGGRLQHLTPSLYGSRKTGVAHRPVAGSGWEIDAGTLSLAQLIAGTARGALVGRLSMGAPAANGDFSGVIKNSFRLRDGALSGALSETMVAGNMARMLLDIVALSRERIDTGATCLPWLRIGGLHFS